MITIIVLLILAGVTIATLTGENGLLSKAQLAKEKTEEARENEDLMLADIENKMSEELDSGRGNSIDSITLSNMIKQGLNDMFKIKTVTYDTFSISGSGNITYDFGIDEGYEAIAITPKISGTGSSYVNVTITQSNRVAMRNTSTSSATDLKLTVLILEKRIENSQTSD